MTLTVTVIYVDELTGKLLDEIPLQSGEHLAGLEQWRSTVYGSPESAKLGLSLLCSLKHQDVLALGSDVAKLKEEVTTLLHALDNAYPYSHRLGNIIRACDLAIARNAAVWIS
ncbi:hypothetical protein ACO0LD_19770 [Undibacterium sp. Ji83W]|uniref:hypothetical protein n=1 Tax=Undibacterium sp. Ji83W TaxID=3413043 RepID=UPI003BF24470